MKHLKQTRQTLVMILGAQVVMKDLTKPVETMTKKMRLWSLSLKVKMKTPKMPTKKIRKTIRTKILITKTKTPDKMTTVQEIEKGETLRITRIQETDKKKLQMNHHYHQVKIRLPRIKRND